MPIPSILGNVQPQRDIGPQVEAELTNLMYTNSRGIHTATLGAYALLTFMVREHVLFPVVAAWLGFALLVETTRAVLAGRFRSNHVHPREARRWRRYFEWGTLIGSLHWGAAGLVLFAPGVEVLQVTLAVVLIGACAVGLPALAGSMTSYLGFLLLALTPVTLRLFIEARQIPVVVGILSIIAAVLLLLFARRTHQRIEAGLRLRFAYAELAEELSDEVAERRSAQDQLDKLTNFDPLTGLPNKALFEDRLTQALGIARRHGERLAVLYVDLDRFKAINDSLGHAAGDEVLRTVGKRLGETPANDPTVARLSSDEFVMLYSESPSAESAALLAQRVMEDVERPIMVETTELRLTCCIGISFFPNDGADAKTLIQTADIAMTRAKKRGRGQYQFYTPDLHMAATRHLARETALRRALEREEFFLEYQPQVDSSTGRVIGFEALVRWRSPDFGVLPPSEFIALTEETGLILPLGEWVLHTACNQASSWCRQFGTNFHIAVNLSACQFEAADLSTTIARILKNAKLPPEMLLLEITESIALANPIRNLEQLRGLRAMRLRLALDDFGTGNSTLRNLQQFPIDMLKLDRGFITHITTNPRDAALVRATISLATALNLQVLAEGVENIAQVQWLQAQHSYLVQGHYFGAPASSEICETLLDATRTQFPAVKLRY